MKEMPFLNRIAFLLALDAYRNLRAIKPNHEYIKLLGDIDQGVTVITDEFMERYHFDKSQWKKGIASDLRVWIAFRMDLEYAIREERERSIFQR